MNVGITGGGGLAYMVSKKLECIVDVRASYGFKTIQKDTNANGKSNTGGLFITVGLAYSLKASHK